MQDTFKAGENKKAIFWDFDGTIIHANESFKEFLHRAIRKNGYEISMEKIADFLKTASSWNTPDIAYPEKTGMLWWKEFFTRCNVFYKWCNIGEEKFEKINLDFKTYILDPQSYTVYKDAATVLRQCEERGYCNYILSNNYPELSLVIRELRLSDFFADFFVSSNIGYEKPRKEIFLYAIHKADNPQCCYMIGDNPMADVRGGKAVGMKTILVHCNADSEADHSFESLSEIPRILI